MLQEQWLALITSMLPNNDVTVVNAHTYLGLKWHSFSGPVLLKCDDDNDYVIKGFNAGRAIINDQIIGRLASYLDAPVPPVTLVNVPQELITMEPELRHIPPGVAHGSLWVPGYTDREYFQYIDVNRESFAKLSVLYGWLFAGDHQFIYRKEPPHHILSVDHGHFFPGGPDWRIESLQTCGSPQLDQSIIISCNPDPSEIDSAMIKLNQITNEIIANTVTIPPDSWGIAIEERAALANFLASRRDLLAQMVLRREN